MLCQGLKGTMEKHRAPWDMESLEAAVDTHLVLKLFCTRTGVNGLHHTAPVENPSSTSAPFSKDIGSLFSFLEFMSIFSFSEHYLILLLLVEGCSA